MEELLSFFRTTQTVESAHEIWAGEDDYIENETRL
jgi:hypothetical protein